MLAPNDAIGQMEQKHIDKKNDTCTIVVHINFVSTKIFHLKFTTAAIFFQNYFM
jgi:hypothetical protein